MNMALFTSFDGRIGRQQWWLGFIVLLIAWWIALLVLGMAFGVNMAAVDPGAAVAQGMGLASVPMIIIALIFTWLWVALYAKRWHDRGKSGWWSLIVLIPIVGFVWIVVELGFLPGTEGPNQHGPDPLAV